MPFAKDNGVAIWYGVTGDGPPLVLSGGFGLLQEQFDLVRPALAAECRVIDWNFRGVGKSDRTWTDDTTFDRWVEDLAVVLDKLRVDRCHIWATSMGSRLSIRFAAHHRTRVAGLIVYPSFTGTVSGAGERNVFADIGETLGYEALARMFQWHGSAAENVYGPKGDWLAQFEAASFKRNFDMAILRRMMATFSGVDLSEDVAALTMPVLILMGASGRYGAEGPGMADAIAHFRVLCPQAELATVPRAGGTYCMLEEPQATVALVLDWLGKH